MCITALIWSLRTIIILLCSEQQFLAGLRGFELKLWLFILSHPLYKKRCGYVITIIIKFQFFFIERKEGEGISDRHRCWKWAINSLKTGGFYYYWISCSPFNKVQLSRQFLGNIPRFLNSNKKDVRYLMDF